MKTKYYFGSPGAYQIVDSELALVMILQVTRSGTTYNVTRDVTGLPDPLALLVKHFVISGVVSWGKTLPFYTPDGGPSRDDLEKISIKFKY